MNPIPPSLQIVYLDLLQSVTHEAPVSIVTRSLAGQSYLQANERQGSTRKVRHVGRADNPKVQQEASRLRREADAAKRGCTLVKA